jgi:oxygen-independent coproporphyrinogen III oxidase
LIGLYVHIPFCSAICNYCNFNRGLFDPALKARYVDALVTDIGRAGLKACTTSEGIENAGRRADLQVRLTSASHAETHEPAAPPSRPHADTIYFGGGTPSLLEPGDVERIVRACERSFAVAPDREVTLEANPETVTLPRLAAFRRAGVTRVSFGVQSFREEELRRLSRLHGADRARSAVSEARAAGFGNISLDLMMWLPQQSVAEWLESVDEAIVLRPEHLSLYLLEVYPNAPLKDDMARARWSQAPDEDAAAMYLTAMERLDCAGYEQYEISNVARPGCQSRHNLKYWTDGEWLGFGCGAHSTYDGVRWRNASSAEEYVDRIQRGQSAAVDIRKLTPDERLGDALFTGLRLNKGVDVTAIQARYGVDVWRTYGRELERFVEGGWLRREGPRLWLTRSGMLLAHEVMAVFV